ncbi:MAG: hypothetical protein JXR77_08505 [Lentisphaeria bacterium]|nr:hypothetical protein [Lentisphaeria bacterium]
MRQRSIGRLGMILGVLLWGAGCRTPVAPPVRPVANLFPTLQPVTVLEGLEPSDVADASLAEMLEEAGVLDPLRHWGLTTAELGTAARGLRRRGYAEIDARRCACPVRWVVLRTLAVTEALRELRVEAGHADVPGIAREYGIDVATEPGERATRHDVYGRGSEVWSWHGGRGGRACTVRRVYGPAGGTVHWETEIRFRIPVRAVAGEAMLPGEQQGKGRT